MPAVDLLFPVVGVELPTDHGYPLYAALSNVLPGLHRPGFRFSVLPITGQYVGRGLLRLNPYQSRMRLRLAAEEIPTVLPLAGKELEVLGRRIRLGVPQVHALHPASCLVAQSVTIKHATEAAPFLTAAERQFAGLGLKGQLEIPRAIPGTRQREPRRHVMRIKDVRIVCFPLLVRGLSPDESLKLQETGLGGRRHMGAGFFVPGDDGRSHKTSDEMLGTSTATQKPQTARQEYGS